MKPSPEKDMTTTNAKQPGESCFCGIESHEHGFGPRCVGWITSNPPAPQPAQGAGEWRPTHCAICEERFFNYADCVHAAYRAGVADHRSAATVPKLEAEIEQLKKENAALRAANLTTLLQEVTERLTPDEARAFKDLLMSATRGWVDEVTQDRKTKIKRSPEQ